MASLYGYITVTALELFSSIDYEVEGEYTDGMVEAVITVTERDVNTRCGQSFASTIPDGIVAATTEVAYRRMYNRMVLDGIMDRQNPKKRLLPLWDDDLQDLIKAFIKVNGAVRTVWWA